MVVAAVVIHDLEISMKTYPISNENGVQVAFEIENVYINCKSIAKLLHELSDIKSIKMQKLFTNTEYRIEFVYKGIDCVVWEPFGDNSRYWIGPRSPEKDKVDIQKIQTLFDSYRPNSLRKFLGDLLSFNFVQR